MLGGEKWWKCQTMTTNRHKWWVNCRYTFVHTPLPSLSPSLSLSCSSSDQSSATKLAIFWWERKTVVRCKAWTIQYSICSFSFNQLFKDKCSLIRFLSLSLLIASFDKISSSHQWWPHIRERPCEDEKKTLIVQFVHFFNSSRRTKTGAKKKMRKILYACIDRLMYILHKLLIRFDIDHDGTIISMNGDDDVDKLIPRLLSVVKKRIFFFFISVLEQKVSSSVRQRSNLITSLTKSQYWRKIPIRSIDRSICLSNEWQINSIMRKILSRNGCEIFN